MAPKDLKLRLEPLREEDIEWARQLHNDPEVLSMLTDPHEVSEEEQRRWFKSLSASRSSERHVVWLGNTPIGVVRYDQIDRYNHSICIGLDIEKEHRGKGYAKPIYRLIFHSLFSSGFNRLWLLVASYNKKALNLYKSLGFNIEGFQRDALFRDGQYYSYVMMSLLRSEYDSTNACVYGS